MRLGINMPWYYQTWYAQDIGPNLVSKYAPPANFSSNDPKKQWMADGPPGYKTILDAQLASWKSYGIECVRWFFIGDGVTLPPPSYDSNTKQWTVPSSQSRISDHVSDFTALLDVFVRQNMLLLPSFVDFALFYPMTLILANSGAQAGSGGDVQVKQGTANLDAFVKSFYQQTKEKQFANSPGSVDWSKFVKQGRAQILQNAASVNQFLDYTLQPLLNASKVPKYKDQILAWEVMNEPEMAFDTKKNNPISPFVTGVTLAAFINAALAMILKTTDFPVTVGFQSAMPLGQDDGTLGKASNTMHQNIDPITKMIAPFLTNPRFWPQCHFYPEGGMQQKVVTASQFNARGKTMVGEFATLLTGNLAWPEIGASDSLDSRLQLLSERGYDWAFPWSANCTADWSDWSNATLQTLGTFSTESIPGSGF